MADQHVLDDRQAEARAAGIARAAPIDAVEALGEPRNVLGRDADPGVRHGEHARPVGLDVPSDADRAAGRGVSHGVRHEVAERARDLRAIAGDARRLADIERHIVLALRQRLGVGGDLQQQRHHRELAVGGRVVLALQRRQRQQVVDEAMHVARLLIHQPEIARALARLEVEVLHRLDEARHHRQRRLELVRDVGDEVATHARDRLGLRDVAAQQELVVGAEGHDLHRQHRRLPGLVHDHRLAEVARLDIALEVGAPHEVGDRLAAVALRIECEQHDRALVHPLDAVRGIEHDHAVGNRLRGLPKAVDDLPEVPLMGTSHAHAPVDRRECRGPRAAAGRDRIVGGSGGPIGDELDVVQVEQDDAERAGGEDAERPVGPADRERQQRDDGDDPGGDEPLAEGRLHRGGARR